MLRLLYTTKEKTKNKELVNEINSRLKDWKKEINKMSQDERKNKKSDKIVKIAKKILKFNKQQQQSGKGLKILTPNQMLSRLPLTIKSRK